jgi:hypothetical protein
MTTFTWVGPDYPLPQMLVGWEPKRPSVGSQDWESGLDSNSEPVCDGSVPVVYLDDDLLPQLAG